MALGYSPFCDPVQPQDIKQSLPVTTVNKAQNTDSCRAARNSAGSLGSLCVTEKMKNMVRLEPSTDRKVNHINPFPNFQMKFILTGILWQPWSNADLQHFITWFENGYISLALHKLHLSRTSTAPGPPALLLQLHFKSDRSV